MSVNKYKPHVLVIPEDDANRQLANGFVLEVPHGRRIQVLPEAGGWSHVCDIFVEEHVSAMGVYPNRFVVMLLDFDNLPENRLAYVREKIPSDLQKRVFVLGARSKPEDMKQAQLGTFESIGRKLAGECRQGKRTIWAHDLLAHNAAELARLEIQVRGFLF